LTGLIRGGRAGWLGLPLFPALWYGTDRLLSKSIPPVKSPTPITLRSLRTGAGI
jgi:hypothetical protein